MARKNLYIPDEDERILERFEKELERRGQSLSEFFLNSVRIASEKHMRGQTERKINVGIQPGSSCALAVDGEWRHSSAINSIIGPPDNPILEPSRSSLIIAKVLRTDDPIGLWIELNTDQKRDPDLPVLNFVIPWRFLLAICSDPSASTEEEAERLPCGFYPGSTVDATTQAGGDKSPR